MLLTNCEDVLCIDELQFGFKRNIAYLQAVLTLLTVMEYFTSRDSTVLLLLWIYPRHYTV